MTAYWQYSLPKKAALYFYLSLSLLHSSVHCAHHSHPFCRRLISWADSVLELSLVFVVFIISTLDFSKKCDIMRHKNIEKKLGLTVKPDSYRIWLRTFNCFLLLSTLSDAIFYLSKTDQIMLLHRDQEYHQPENPVWEDSTLWWCFIHVSLSSLSAWSSAWWRGTSLIFFWKQQVTQLFRQLGEYHSTTGY